MKNFDSGENHTYSDWTSPFTDKVSQRVAELSGDLSEQSERAAYSEHDYDPETLRRVAEAQVAYEQEQAAMQARQEKIDTALEYRDQLQADRRGMLIAAGISEEMLTDLGFESPIDTMETWTDEQIEQFTRLNRHTPSRRNRLVRPSNHKPRDAAEHLVVESYVQDTNLTPDGKPQETFGLRIEKNMGYALPTRFNMGFVGNREKGATEFEPFERIKFDIRVPLTDDDGEVVGRRTYWIDLRTGSGKVDSVSVFDEDNDPIERKRTRRDGAYPKSLFYDDAEREEHIARAKELLDQLAQDTGVEIPFEPDDGKEFDLGTTVRENIVLGLNTPDAMPVVRYRPISQTSETPSNAL